MLLADPGAFALSGAGRQAAEWAQHYDFEDTDGRTIPPFEMPEELRLKHV
jgi:hypothetical protein